jgi:acetyl-CoA acetyltransferase
MTAIRTAEETTGVDRLRELIEGHVVLPGEHGWGLARQAWTLAAAKDSVAVASVETGRRRRGGRELRAR